MNGEYILAIVILWLIICIILQNREHRKTVDKLLNRLVGIEVAPKSKSEPIKEDDSSPVKDDEPKGWYDH